MAYNYGVCRDLISRVWVRVLVLTVCVLKQDAFKTITACGRKVVGLLCCVMHVKVPCPVTLIAIREGVCPGFSGSAAECTTAHSPCKPLQLASTLDLRNQNLQKLVWK